MVDAYSPKSAVPFICPPLGPPFGPPLNRPNPLLRLTFLFNGGQSGRTPALSVFDTPF